MHEAQALHDLLAKQLFIYGADTIETHAQLYFSQLQRFLASAGLQAPPWLAQQLKAWTARLLGAATADLPLPVCEAPKARFRRKDCFTAFVIPPTTSYLLVDV